MKMVDIFGPGGMAAWNPPSAIASGLLNAMGGNSLAAPEIAFTDAARAQGVEISGEAVGDGKIHRVPHSDSKRGEKDAWYILFTDGDIAAGAYGCWKGLEFTTTWHADTGRTMTWQEQADHKRRMDRAKADAQAEREVHRQEASARASDDVSRWIDATDEHPYLQAKRVKAHPGVKMDGAGRLIIPFQNADGKTQTYQSIGPAPDFAKRFLKDGAKRGTFFQMRGRPDQVFICEGYATAATVYAATGGATVIVAGDAGSLTEVAKIQRNQFLGAQIFIAGDNDAFTLVAGVPVNAGITKGAEAAKAVNGVLLYPTFNEADLMAHPKGAPTDWNDLAASSGIDAVREQIEATTRAHTQRGDFEFVRSTHLQIKHIDWLVKGYVEANTLAQVFGESGCGKSFVILDMACCVATGVDWIGHKVQKGAVFYICGEGHAGISRRLRAWEIGNDLSLENGLLFKSLGAAQLCEALTINKNGAAQVAAAIKKMVEVSGVWPRLIIIDTLSRNYGGDENSTEEMAAFIQHLDEYLRKPWDCTVMIAHHSGAQDKDRSRGSTALRGAIDSEYKVSRDQVSGVITVEPKKMKDADLPTPVMLKLNRVVLSQADGIPVVDEDGVAEMGAYLVNCTADVTAMVANAKERAAADKKAANQDAAGDNQALALKEIKTIYKLVGDGKAPNPPLTEKVWRKGTKVEYQRRKEAINGLAARGLIRVSDDAGTARIITLAGLNHSECSEVTPIRSGSELTKDSEVNSEVTPNAPK